MVTAETIARIGGGGTAVGAPVQHLLDNHIRVDCFIGITDNEDWAHSHGYDCRGSFLDLWRSYRQRVNPSAQAFLVTIMLYRDAVAPSREKGVHFIYGWSDQILKYIPLKLKSGSGQTEEIERIQFRLSFGIDYLSILVLENIGRERKLDCTLKTKGDCHDLENCAACRAVCCLCCCAYCLHDCGYPTVFQYGSVAVVQ